MDYEGLIQDLKKMQARAMERGLHHPEIRAAWNLIEFAGECEQFRFELMMRR